MPRKRKQEPEASGGSSSVSVDPSIDPSTMKVADLKNELLKRRLDTTGKKPELIARLEDALQATVSPTKKPKVEPAATSSTASSSSAPVDYSKMKMADLKKELESQGLGTSGKKPELVARLQGGKGGSSVKIEPKEEEAVEETDFSKAKRALAASTTDKKKKSTKQRKVDPHCCFGGGMDVFEDWDCMLNQTNIGHNNNKFYVIQLLKTKFGDRYLLWTRWGRVGESGQNSGGTSTDLETAKKEFRKKFSDKTKNKWEERDSFKPVPGKYTLIEMDDDDDEPTDEMTSKLAALDEPDSGPAPTKLPCSLDKSTQTLVKLIFNDDMFNNALKNLEIDTKKMPLGKLSKIQITKGIEALEAIEAAIDAGKSKTVLADLASKFYTIIPHDFGRRIPPIIADKETLQKKFDVLVVLGDIEIAQGMQNVKNKIKSEVTEVPHELDVHYKSLNTDLTPLDSKSPEYEVISKYMVATSPVWRNLTLLDVWRVDRHGVDDRIKPHDGIANRRLLWHGTNVAVVAAILKSGLRIMPHSGGRVGKGIYLASENSKSAGYVGCAADGTGIMFLNETVLGKEYHITMDDWRLTAPPPGYDCIIAKGRTEPDPKDDTVLTMGAKEVKVPQGKPIPTSFSSSNFSQSEYLVYKENQTRIRYMLKIKFN